MSSIERFTANIVGSLRDISLLVVLSGLAWWWVNDYSISEAIGFDPLRYEYYAEYGLPNAFSDSSSYRLVQLLSVLYNYSPFYIGYLIFIWFLCLGLRFFDSNKVISGAILSPIAFYYIGQTGKDGIAVIACVGAAMLATYRQFNAGVIAFSLIVIGLSLYIRPAALLILPLVMLQYRLGTSYAIVAAVLIAVAFNISIDSYDILGNLESLTSDDGAGQSAQVLRAYTFGYSIEAITTKISLLFISPIFQPLLGVVKFLSGSPKFVLYEGAAFLLFVANLIRGKGVAKFLVASIPYVVVIGATSPFYHFRYLAVAYPAVWAFCLYSPGWGWKLTSASKSPSAVDGGLPGGRKFEIGI